MKKELLDFIKKAKQATYASESSVEKKGEDGGKNYKVEEGDWTYTDTYFGNLVDCGQERIYENGKVIWMMAYRGGTLEKYDPEDCYPYVNKEGTAWVNFTPLMQGFTTGEDD